MRVYKVSFPSSGELVSSLVALPELPSAALRVGVARIPVGVRVPDEGYSSHRAHELSLLLRGVLQVESGGQKHLVQAGELTLIPAGEAHSALAVGKEDVELLWIWFGEDEQALS